MKGDLTVFPEAEAKKLFRELKRKGFFLSIGRATGEIWTRNRKTKLYWCLKDMVGNWILEQIFEEKTKI